MDETNAPTGQATARPGPIAALWQRLRGQTPPEPFRDSDFEGSEWAWSAFDAQPGPAD
jgi:hypothetical protein